MTEVEKAIAEALILIEAEKEIDRLRTALKAKTLYSEALRRQRDEIHEIATDLWLYGTARSANRSSKGWRDAVERFEHLDELITETKEVRE